LSAVVKELEVTPFAVVGVVALYESAKPTRGADMAATLANSSAEKCPKNSVAAAYCRRKDGRRVGDVGAVVGREDISGFSDL